MKARVAVLKTGLQGSAGVLAEPGADLEIIRESGLVEDVLGACQAGLAEAALFIGGTGSVTATLVDRLNAVGCVAIALTDDVDEETRLMGFGAVVLSLRSSAYQIARMVRSTQEKMGLERPDVPPDSSGKERLADSFWSDPSLRSGPAVSPAGFGDRQSLPEEPESGFDPEATVRSGVERTPDWDVAPMGLHEVLVHRSIFEPPRADQREVHDAGTHSLGTVAPGGIGPGTGPVKPRHAPRTSRPEPERPGQHPGSPGLTAVWGPVGAPGRSTVAINLAAELALLGHSVILIDADTYGASMAAMLGLLDESATLAQACRDADLGQLTSETLRRSLLTVTVKGQTLGLLSGLTRPERWSELRGAAFQSVLQMCLSQASHVIVDIGFSLEDDDELSFDSLAPRRNAVALTALAMADQVVAVGEATAVALPRMVRMLPRLTELTRGTPVFVLMNKVRSGSVGRFAERQIQEAWDRFAEGAGIHAFLPSEPAILDAALKDGMVLAESAASSTLRSILQRLACASDQRTSASAVSSTTPRRRAKR